ncbi:MAG: beta-propeller fold lactonase family protein [Dehalococcoidia bacterium]
MSTRNRRILLAGGALAVVALTVTLLAGGRETSAGVAAGPLAYISNTSSDDVWVVDLDAQAVVDVVPVGDDPRGIDIAPDNSNVYVANRFDDTVSVIDTTTNTVADTIDLGASVLVTATEPYDVVVSPDNAFLYIAMKNGGSENGDGTVAVAELPSGDVIAEEILDSAASPEGIVVTPDGNKVYVAARGAMYVVDVSDPANPSFTGTSGVAERELVVSPDGEWVYADNNAVRTSDDTAFATGDSSGERGIAISPDGLQLFSTDETDDVWVVDVTPGDPPTTAFLQDIQDVTQSESYGVDLTDEGDRGLVSFRGSNTVRIFDVATLSFIGPVIDMQFDPGTGTIFGSEPKQLVISHTIQPTPTPTPTPEPGAATPTATPTAAAPAELPDTGGTPGPDSGLPWLAILAAVGAAAVAGGAIIAARRR